MVIDKTGSLKINEDPCDWNQLGQKLEDIFKMRAEKVAFVKGDPDLDFQIIAKAIDIAHASGVDKVGLMTPKVEAGQ
jgi:biopolymer transport protein ExbD